MTRWEKIKAFFSAAHFQAKKWASLILFFFALVSGVTQFIPVVVADDLTPEGQMHYLWTSIFCFIIAIISGIMYAHVAHKAKKKDDNEGGYGPDGFV